MPEVDIDAAGGPPSAHVLAVYQVLGTRFTTNGTLTWTVPTLGLSAQAFRISAATQPGNSLATDVLLAVAILVIGVVATAVSQIFDNAVVTDRLLLERYEKLLLGDRWEYLGLRHNVRIMDRERALALRSPDERLRDRLRLSRAVRASGGRVAWAFVLLATTLVGAAIPLLRGFGI